MSNNNTCPCSYLKKTVSKASLYGMGKVATTKLVSKAPKSEDVVMEKVSKSKFKNEIFTSVGAYIAATYGWWYMQDMAQSYEPTSLSGLPIDVVGDVYKAAIIELVNFLMGKGSMNGFLHELLLVGVTDVAYNSLDMMY